MVAPAGTAAPSELSLGDDQVAGEDRRAAGIGVGAVQGDAVAGVVAELHDEADIGRADGDRRGGGAGVDRRDAGEVAVAVERAVGERRIADDAAERDSCCERMKPGSCAAVTVPAMFGKRGLARCRQIPLGRDGDIARRQIGQSEAAIGVAIGGGLQEVRIEAGHLVEAGRRCAHRAGDVDALVNSLELLFFRMLYSSPR